MQGEIKVATPVMYSGSPGFDAQPGCREVCYANRLELFCAKLSLVNSAVYGCLSSFICVIPHTT